jgi:hypothetical protein
MLRIDPRFAQRWVQVRRDQGRRRLRLVAVGAVLTVLIGLAVGSFYSPLLRVRHVRVTVVGDMAPATVQAIAGLGHYQLMIKANPAAAAARLDADPRLGDARVTKTWPGTVSVRVWVRFPVALVPGPVVAGQQPRWATVDPTGRVLGLVTAPPPSLTVVTGVGVPPAPGQWIAGSAGPGGTAAVEAGHAPVDVTAASNSPTLAGGPAVAFSVAQLMPASIRPDVSQVTVGPNGQVSMSVLPATIATGSITVLLGDGSQLASKLTALTALLTQTSLSGVTSINLTVPDRPAALTAR